MQLSRPLAPLKERQKQLQLIQALASQHSIWLDHLSRKYNRPRVELVQLLSRPGALEREIATLISESALGDARELMQAGDWPNSSSPDLYDRAVAGHWRRLRDAEIKKNEQKMAEIKALVND